MSLFSVGLIKYKLLRCLICWLTTKDGRRFPLQTWTERRRKDGIIKKVFPWRDSSGDGSIYKSFLRLGTLSFRLKWSGRFKDGGGVPSALSSLVHTTRWVGSPQHWNSREVRNGSDVHGTCRVWRGKVGEGKEPVLSSIVKGITTMCRKSNFGSDHYGKET